MISFEHVSKSFTTQGKTLYAVKEVMLDIDKGEIFGVIGFSGAGEEYAVASGEFAGTANGRKGDG